MHLKSVVCCSLGLHVLANILTNFSIIRGKQCGPRSGSTLFAKDVSITFQQMTKWMIFVVIGTFRLNYIGALLFQGLEKMTEAAPPDDTHKEAPMKELATSAGTHSVQPKNEIEDPMESPQVAKKELQKTRSLVSTVMSPNIARPLTLRTCPSD